jgi:four helix bundle protein
MRDHRKLRAFELADQLVLSIYKGTKSFPREEQFGLTSQLRRAAVSIASNIVEGCARNSQADYVRFLDMAFGSVREVEYQLTIASRLGYLPSETGQQLASQADETARVLAGLLRSLRNRRES